jgi:hypothetical protein
MKRLMIKLTPEQEAGIREAFGFDSERACNILQFELDDREIEAIRAGMSTCPVPPYLVVPSVGDAQIEGPVSFS